jgi:hypothetical protein
VLSNDAACGIDGSSARRRLSLRKRMPRAKAGVVGAAAVLPRRCCRPPPTATHHLEEATGATLEKLAPPHSVTSMALVEVSRIRGRKRGPDQNPAPITTLFATRRRLRARCVHARGRRRGEDSGRGVRRQLCPLKGFRAQRGKRTPLPRTAGVSPLPGQRAERVYSSAASVAQRCAGCSVPRGSAQRRRAYALLRMRTRGAARRSVLNARFRGGRA